MSPASGLPSPPPRAAAAAKVLIVDDRADNLLALEAILQSLGHELVRATSGAEALKRLLTDTFAVILLDVQMPGMDGFETAEHIQRREKTRHTPILFLTAGTAEAHQTRRGYAVGAVDYLAKPFDPWVLRAKVGFFIDLHVRQAEQTARLEALEHDVEALRPARLVDTVAEAQRVLDDGDTVRAKRLLADLHRVLEGTTGEGER